LCEEVESRSDTGHVTKIPDFENSRWWTAAWFYRYISAGNHPISMKFGVPLQILVLRTVMWCDTVSKYCKFKMADGRHVENWLLAISPRFIVRL